MVVGVVMPAGVVVFMRVRVGRYMCAPLLHLRSVVMPGRAVPGGGWQPVAVFVAVFVAVVPELGLVEQKEKHQAHQQRGKQVVGIDMAFKRLGQQVHEGGGQQGACRQAEQALRPHTGAAPLEPHPHQQRCQPDAADTRSQGGQNDCY